jgi:thioredoxin 1
VRNIPTVLVFQNGEVVGRQVGVAPKNAYAEAFDALIINRLLKEMIKGLPLR